jgi:hypothetical protein
MSQKQINKHVADMSLDASLRQRSRGRLRLGLVAEKVETTS